MGPFDLAHIPDDDETLRPQMRAFIAAHMLVLAPEHAAAVDAFLQARSKPARDLKD